MGFVVVKGSGGAGMSDRLDSLFVALMYAEVHSRNVYVDWQDTAYGNGDRNYFFDLFAARSGIVCENPPFSRDIFPPAWIDSLHMQLNDIAYRDLKEWDYGRGVALYSFDQSKAYKNDVLVMFDFGQFTRVRLHYIEKYNECRALSDNELRKHVFEKHLSFSSSVLAHLDASTKSMHLGTRIGVHVRLTNESEAKRTTPKVEQYFRAVDAIRRRMGDVRDIFLATDNSEVQTRFSARYGESVCWRDKWMPNAGDPIHMNGACPDRLSAARDTLVDALALARCQVLVLSGPSGFSRLASILAGSSKPTIFLDLHPSLAGRIAAKTRRIFCRFLHRCSSG